MGNSAFHVYTHFYPYKNGEVFTEGRQKGTLKGCRWRTLLQIGNSWDVLGSAVMMNPGSSDFAEGFDLEHPVSNPNTLDALNRFDPPGDDWFEFKPDATMKRVADLFAHYFGLTDDELFLSAKTVEERKRYTRELRTRGERLRGVIQIFNLTNLRDPDPEAALSAAEELRLQEKRLNTAHDDIELLVPPVYYGFKSWIERLGIKSQVDAHREYARMLMNISDDIDPFMQIRCYHPSYIFGRGAGSDLCWKALREFRDPSLNALEQ